MGTMTVKLETADAIAAVFRKYKVPATVQKLSEYFASVDYDEQHKNFWDAKQEVNKLIPRATSSPEPEELEKYIKASIRLQKDKV
jgi:hypothetical protein